MFSLGNSAVCVQQANKTMIKELTTQYKKLKQFEILTVTQYLSFKILMNGIQKPQFTAPWFTADPDLPPLISGSQNFVNFMAKMKFQIFKENLLIIVASVKLAC
jgi:hypothetical protein